MRTQWLRLVFLVALIPAACTGSATPNPSRPDAAGIVWLCLPGQAVNPCQGNLSVTSIDPSGNRSVSQLTLAADAPIDCFYVYPTTSRQTTINADLSIDPEERAVAIAQAAPFSQVCKVYAPIYRQLTIPALSSGQIQWTNVQTAYDGVKAAFDDYLASYNRGRGIVFIGHSQGAMLLISLLEDEVDSKPEVRKLLVSALLMGGNASVAGQSGGGDFANIRTCSSASQTGCVVGYSTFAGTPPEEAAFARVTRAIGMLRPPRTGEQIMCVNPTAPGGKGTLRPMFPTVELAQRPDAPKPVPTTTYVAYPDEFSAECRTDGDAAWLQVTPTGSSGVAPVLSGSEGPTWGLHDFDVSLALGDLVGLVRSEAEAFRS